MARGLVARFVVILESLLQKPRQLKVEHVMAHARPLQVARTYGFVMRALTPA